MLWRLGPRRYRLALIPAFISSAQPDAITVLVPTFARPGAFRTCLRALTAQTSAPAEVVVVMRPDDAESRRVADEFLSVLPIRIAFVTAPGHVQALNCGLTATHTPFVAITDDDAAPRPDWLQRIHAHFTDPTVGAVGGRDFVYWRGDLLDGTARRVGRVRWYGRVLGNHHLSSGCQDVQFLKGANMSYRREALLGFDENLSGDGAQACNDLQASLWVHRAGWRVIWDPQVAVDHFPAERLDDDRRGAPSLRAAINISHNQTYVLLSLLSGWPKVTSLLYSIIVGSQAAPGLLMLPVVMLKVGLSHTLLFVFRANLEGRVRGILTFLRTEGRPLTPPDLSAPSRRR